MKFMPICIAACTAIFVAGPVSAETLKITIADVKPSYDTYSNAPILTLTLSPESKAALAAFTTARVGEQVKLRVGSKVLSEPIIREPILGGALVINGGFSEEDAQELARAILKVNGNIEVDGSDK